MIFILKLQCLFTSLFDIFLIITRHISDVTEVLRQLRHTISKVKLSQTWVQRLEIEFQVSNANHYWSKLLITMSSLPIPIHFQLIQFKLSFPSHTSSHKGHERGTVPHGSWGEVCSTALKEAAAFQSTLTKQKLPLPRCVAQECQSNTVSYSCRHCYQQPAQHVCFHCVFTETQHNTYWWYKISLILYHRIHGWLRAE